MKKLLPLLLAILTGWGSLSAALTGDYLFKLQIDDTVKDQSGNDRHPLNFFGENSWYQGDLDGIVFRNGSDALKLPPAAFARPQGSVEMTVMAADTNAPQTILRLYSRGDGFQLMLKNGSLRASFYCRARKKWYHAGDKKILFPAKKWINIRVTYSMPGRMELYLDGRRIGGCTLDFTPDIPDDALLSAGNDHVGNSAFRLGVLHRLTFSDTPDATPEKTAETATPARTRTIRLGGLALDITLPPARCALAGLRRGKTEFLSNLRREPLWELELRNRATGARIKRNAGATAPEISANDDALELRWPTVSLPGGKNFSVTARVRAAGKETLHWTLETNELPEPWAVDTVLYPVVACGATSADPQKMFLTYPAYYGRNQHDPFTFANPRPGTRYGNFYPDGAHMQFCFLYGEDRPGLFIMTPDAEGYCKEFRFTARPKERALVFQMYQYPRQKAISRRFVSAYPVETAIMDGDWYDAAKRYRRWAIRQLWCAKGTLARRTDLPAWATEIDLATRPITLPRRDYVHRAVGAARIEPIRKNSRFLHDLLPVSTLAVWYCYHFPYENLKSVGQKAQWMCAFNGWFDSPPIDGVKETIAEFSRLKFHHIGYLNSRIYDQSLDPDYPEMKAIQPAVMRDIDGKFQLYGRLLYDVCRHDPRWQDHLLNLIRRDTIALNFEGMYMDSFGRGQHFCYAEDHGHLPGDACASVAGQRAMAQKIREEMRQVRPGFVLSSEASTEQFVDLIDFKLHHYNLHQDGVPLWTAVYHDYQLVYGRTALNPRHHSAAIFHVGGILGRFFPASPDFVQEYFPEGAAAFYKQLAALRREFRGHLTLGEMLRPPTVACALQPEYGKDNKSVYVAPPVFGSAWRNEAGEIALFFTNCRNEPAEFEFTLKGAEFDPVRGKPWTLVVPDADGKPTRKPWLGGKYTLPPLSSVAIECGR